MENKCQIVMILNCESTSSLSPIQIIQESKDLIEKLLNSNIDIRIQRLDAAKIGLFLHFPDHLIAQEAYRERFHKLLINQSKKLVELMILFTVLEIIFIQFHGIYQLWILKRVFCLNSPKPTRLGLFVLYWRDPHLRVVYRFIPITALIWFISLMT